MGLVSWKTCDWDHLCAVGKGQRLTSTESMRFALICRNAHTSVIINTHAKQKAGNWKRKHLMDSIECLQCGQPYPIGLAPQPLDGLQGMCSWTVRCAYRDTLTQLRTGLNFRALVLSDNDSRALEKWARRHLSKSDKERPKQLLTIRKNRRNTKHFLVKDKNETANKALPLITVRFSRNYFVVARYC